MSSYILVIDQGTTSSRAILFGADRKLISFDQREITQFFPASEMVEHDATEIWRSVVETGRNAIAKAGIHPQEIAGIGITNQRETVVVWDKVTGKPIHNAIVWQDRRTADVCDALELQGAAKLVEDTTGLLLDPYFSASKIAWLLDNIVGARRRAEAGELLFGTIDSYLIWMLTRGRQHSTDATNASRTSLFNITTNRWDADLLSLFRVPAAMLPRVKDSAADFGHAEEHFFGAKISILGVAGDQQAAMIGHGCFDPGMIKSTYGTGCFVVLNTGEHRVHSRNKMLSTIAYRLNGKTTYALEGSIFVAGAAVQWLRDSLGVIKHAEETGQLARDADEDENVILVPAFTGLGAPYWAPKARGAIFGLTRGSGLREIVRATLEAVCFQTRDLLEAMANDYRFELSANGLLVDGGMSASDWTMQALANCLGCRVDRKASGEMTAFGAAWLAGTRAGIWQGRPGVEQAAEMEARFECALEEHQRQARYDRWKAAVSSTLSFAATS